VVAGAPAGTTPAGCSTSIPAPLPGIADPVSQAVLVGTPAQPGVALQLLGAQQQLHASLQPPTAANPSTLPAAIAAVEQVMYGLSHTITGATDTGGVKQILALLNGDVVLGKIIAGLQAASTGLGQLSTGAVTAADGAQTLADATGDAATGSKTLDAGLGQLATGTADLASGLAQISMGVHISATSLPSAADGASQIADGADQLRAGAPQVRGGILDLQSQAVEPLLAQLTNGSLNAKKQVAILVAASKLAGQAPGGAGSAYVLSQSPTGFRLAAAKVSGGSNTGRNLGIGLGALAALVISVTAGFVLGRRAQVAQH
jgi:X-X-X-Leu-X-X-Gly heptad repeat protein